MGYQIYKVGQRWGGYGVPAICEHPSCNKEIDRGVSFACGGEPFSEYGCDRYFCDKHRYYSYPRFNEDGVTIDEDFCVALCEKCKNGEEPFDYKQEHKDWVKHLLTDKSWAEWRKNNQEEVKKLTKLSLSIKI